jgi:hypothetical protein
MSGKFIIAKYHLLHYGSEYLYSKPRLTPTFCNRQHHPHDYKCLPPSEQQMRLLCGLSSGNCVLRNSKRVWVSHPTIP